MGRKEEMEIEPAQTGKLVLVAGGGPAGMETAAMDALVNAARQRLTAFGGAATITRAREELSQGVNIA